ncbi:hypothetical protein FA95DRAFT_1558431 [Auriscalpium vulgare]|uniref:Uncharacterized protein n=1 Tax=Auriscalpium vulgare TaxID=40419 RepID=A0ACB8RVQ4_9AGAM|nr:hypothetical protein FA95DRAFT_1558431 [Auriscalpium vulgare]
MATSTHHFTKEINSLRAKVRDIEAERLADHNREREAQAADAARRRRLDGTLKQLQEDVRATRCRCAGHDADAREQLELAVRDKEQAERRAERAEAQVEELLGLVAVAVELGVIRSGSLRLLRESSW